MPARPHAEALRPGATRRPRRRVAGVTAATVLAAGLGPFVAAPSASAAPTELFISEYVEGSSNNKAIEIYNGTGAPVDLLAGQYGIRVYFNGATSPGGTIALTGTVAPGDVYVVAATSASAPVLAQADQTTGASLWNGDDAVELTKAGSAVDVEVLEVPEDFLPDFRPPDIALPARERAVPAAEVTVPAAARAAAGAAFGSDFGSAT